MKQYPGHRKELRIIITCLFLLFALLLFKLLITVRGDNYVHSGDGIFRASLVLGMVGLLYLYIRITENDF